MDKYIGFNRNNLPTPTEVLNMLSIKIPKPNRGGFFEITCPVHSGGKEKHPSLHVHNVDGYFLCQACNVKGGDVIDLWCLYTRENFKQAIQSLGCSDDAALGSVVSHAMPYFERMLETGKDILKDKQEKARLLKKSVMRHKRLAQPAPETHGYLKLKGIKLQNLKVVDGYLIIPMYTGRCQLVSYQRIWPDRTKKVLANTPVSGLYGLVGLYDETKPIIICEGLSKAYAIWASLGIACFISFGHSNLTDALKTILMHFQHNAEVIIAADNDPHGFGLESARKALESLKLYRIKNVRIAIPKKIGEDFCDLYQAEGAAALVALFDEVMA
jgi:phage/plasmid primase-like uncharacterized protein